MSEALHHAIENVGLEYFNDTKINNSQIDEYFDYVQRRDDAFADFDHVTSVKLTCHLL